MKKKIIAFVLVVAVGLVLFGCSGEKDLKTTLIDGGKWELVDGSSSATESGEFMTFGSDGRLVIESDGETDDMSYTVENDDKILADYEEMKIVLTVESYNSNEVKGTFSSQYEDEDGEVHDLLSNDFVLYGNRG